MIGTLIVWAASLALTQPPGEAATLADYNARKAATPDSADAHWKLGLWAEQKGLKGEATVEFLAVTRLDPARDAAWKKLGLEKHDGRWITPEEVAAEKAEAEARRKAEATWTPLLRKWKTMLAQKSRQAEAEAGLAGVKDPRAIPSIWKIFGQGTPDDQERAVDLLGHIDDERASRALAGLAVFGKSDLVRRSAVETLSRRNPDDVLMYWVGLLRKPVKYEVRQVAGPGSPGFLTVEGARYNVRRSYAPPSMSQTQALFVDNPNMARHTLPLQTSSVMTNAPPIGSKLVGWSKQNGSLYVFDYTWAGPPPPPKGPDPSPQYQSFEKGQLQAQIDRDFEMFETAKMAEGAQAQLQHDVEAIEAGNATTRELNARLAEALRRVSGKDLGDDKEAWLKWYLERRGYRYVPPADRPRPTVDVQVPLPYVPQAGPPIVTAGGGGGGGDSSGWCMIWEHDKGQKPRTGHCCVAGTPVQTPGGPRAIETLRPGDLVLTGEGPGRPDHPGPVRVVHRSRAERTLRLTLGGEALSTRPGLSCESGSPSPTRGEGARRRPSPLVGEGWVGGEPVTVSCGKTAAECLEATEGHPFWRLGTGWARAADLRPGDEVATREGPMAIQAIEPRGTAEVWNLEIDGGATYQVGKSGVIVHDFR